MYNNLNAKKSTCLFLKKLNTLLPYDPSIPLLGIHAKELTARIHTLVCQCSVTLFTGAKMWR